MNSHYPVGKISLILVLLNALQACSSDNSSVNSNGNGNEPETDETEQASLIWSACEGSNTLQCAKLNVPVDYSLPDLRSIELALARLPAPAATRKGVLLLNPGGPGGSGVELMVDLSEDIRAAGVPAAILNEYDIVSFDPRGIGGSEDIDCTEFGLDDLDVHPTTISALTALEEASTAFAAACYNKYGDYLLQVGSNNVARDMDKLRKTMGEPELNFIGYSYGSRLAATYLQLFPENVGALVMDAALPPDPALELISRQSLEKMHTNLEELFINCSELVENCNPPFVLSGLASRMNALLESGDAETFDLVGEVLARSAEMPDYGALAEDALIVYASEGDASVIQQFLEIFASVYGDDAPDEDDNDTSLRAVMCADDAARPNAPDLMPLLATYNAVSDLFAEAFLANAGLCMGWPSAIDPVESLSERTDTGLLIVGGTSDAQTPLRWSEAMAEVTGSPLIVSGHAGHTVVFQDNNACVDQQVVAFIREGTKPGQTDC